MRSHRIYLCPLWLCVQVVLEYVGQYQLVMVIFLFVCFKGTTEDKQNHGACCI